MKSFDITEIISDNKTDINLKKKVLNILENFEETFAKKPKYYFSAAGRVELSGNHTDYCNGLVLTSDINLKMYATVSPSSKNEIALYSHNLKQLYKVDLTKNDIANDDTINIIKGVVAGFKFLGYNAKGFDAYIYSEIPIGSGLSSSAAFEILLGKILSALYNENQVSKLELAQIGKYAENKFLKKPSGLMDQLASVYGGIIKIDFENESSPKIQQINFNFEKNGFIPVIVNTKSSHNNHTNEYAKIESDMRSIATILNETTCREIKYEEILKNIDLLRKKASDRAILRIIHFLNENKRVEKQAETLLKGDMKTFLKLVKESGDSSFKWLQNIYLDKNPKCQSISLALAITENFLQSEGACRVHGGGFGGTILAFVPTYKYPSYKKLIESVFGEKSTIEILGQ